MRRFATFLLLVSFICLANIPTPSALAEEPGITSPTVLEDRSAVADRLLESARQRAEELQALETVQAVEGLNLSEAFKKDLPKILPKESPTGFRKRYKIELDLAENADKAHAWRTAANALLSHRRFDEAYGAAWRFLQMAGSTRDRALALDTFVKIMLDDGKAPEALATLRETQVIHRENSRQAWLNQVEGRFMLRIIDQIVDVESPTPRACLVLSHALQAPLPIQLKDYVRYDIPRDIAVRSENERVCFTGLTYGDKLDVTLLAGLPGKEGAKLYEDARRTIVIPDRPARVLFGNGTYILPRIGDETVPLKSVNVTSASLSLFRVPDRGLVPYLNAGFDEQNLNEWAQQNLGDNLGERVWEGIVDIENTKNGDVTTLVPIRAMLKSVKPGLYALVATTEEEKKQRQWMPRQTQWLVLSDLGVMTLQGTDGMHVFVNSLDSAKPLRNVAVEIVARNNEVLAAVKTDKQGQATIGAELLRGKGGNMPMALTATSADGDYTFIKLQAPALDLSDRGAEGRTSGGPLDAFLYTERGIYRPGEKVLLSGLLRDGQAHAVANLPLGLVITRPDGVEALKKRISGDSVGTYAFDYDLSPAARTGMWRVSLHADDENNSIGETYFQVDDFVPERLTTKLETVEQELAQGAALEVHVKADFLYGAPGADLAGMLHASLEADPAPFKAWKGYRFGLAQEEFPVERLTSVPFRTGEDGLARVALLADRIPETTLPLRAKLTAEVSDVGGRPVQDARWLPVKHAPVMVGIRAGQDGSFRDGDAATLSVVAADSTGAPLKGHALTAVWVKEHYNYTWYQTRGSWQYRTNVYDETLGEEAVQSGEDGLAELSRTLPWGRYRLDVFDPAGKAASSTRFTVGWWATSESPDVPDGLELTLENDTLQSGERVRGYVKAPFEGVAILTVASDRVLATKTIQLGADGGKFDFKVKEDWGPSAYILATALHPNAGTISRLPVRATGLAWFSIDRKQRSRAIRIDVPETALPGRQITIPIRLEGERPTGDIRVTVAAVDEGILGITRFKTPNPDGFYFGKRGFAFDVRDIYGRLIRSEEGKRGNIRTGGDALEDVMVTGTRMSRGDAEGNLFSPITRTTKTVSLLERNIPIDKNGEGSVTLTLPDFMGQLRLMAVAASADTVGTGKATLVVRTPVVADLVTPRFLAPGDRAQATFSIQNLSGKDGDFEVALSSASPAIDLQALPARISLRNGERRDIAVPLAGVTIGTAGIDLSVTGMDLEPVKRHYDISVRAAWPYMTRRVQASLAPGEAGTAGSLDLGDFFEGTVQQSLVVSSRPNLEADRLFRDLYDYPYRCSEQTVSRALPNLFHKELDGLYQLSLDESKAANIVDNAIMILLDRQKADGSFGLWHGFGSSYDWLDAYVTDFLLRARDKGYFVPEAATTMAISRLKRMVGNRARGLMEAKAYAHYVLARNGEASASEIRYFADQFGTKLLSPLAVAQTAGALFIVGETDTAEQFFARAVQMSRPDHSLHGDYGSRLRDLAAITTILSETDAPASYMAKLAEALEASVAADRWLSTQEMAWLARAAAVYAGENAGNMAFTLGGKDVDAAHGFWKQIAKEGESFAATPVTNTGETAIRVIQTLRAVSKSAPEKSANGFSYNRSFYDLDGKPVDATTLPRNGRFVVVLSGMATAETIENPLLVDLLPAGLEIDSTDLSGLTFLANLSHTEFADARDDRFVAAIEVPSYARRANRSFKVAYIVRAITPGDYVMPGPFVEDMYKPEYRYQGEASRLVIGD